MPPLPPPHTHALTYPWSSAFFSTSGVITSASASDSSSRHVATLQSSKREPRTSVLNIKAGREGKRGGAYSAGSDRCIVNASRARLTERRASLPPSGIPADFHPQPTPECVCVSDEVLHHFARRQYLNLSLIIAGLITLPPCRASNCAACWPRPPPPPLL